MTTGHLLDDARRLGELRALAILDTAPESNYDDLAALAATLAGSPVAAVNFVDADRHFTKAIVGLPEAASGSVPSDLSFCAATIQEPTGILVVSDTHADLRWSEHLLVTGGPQVRFYAGVSLQNRGERVGVLCAFGFEAQDVNDRTRTALMTLARQAETQLELRRRNFELSRLAVSDPLTGLANRTLLFDRLHLALSERARSGTDVGVLFCDVDDFKGINDRHGHEAGDRVLCDLAKHLTANVRTIDTVARIAGDEFAVVCPDVTNVELDQIAKRLTGCGALRLPDGKPAPRVSVGAVLASANDTPASVLRRADQAMYADKRRQRPVTSPPS